jgi:hypothetical protein
MERAPALVIEEDAHMARPIAIVVRAAGHEVTNCDATPGSRVTVAPAGRRSETSHSARNPSEARR